MPLYRGVVTKNALEGGTWMLHTDDGKQFQLQGGDGGLRREGQKVEIEGKIDKDAVSIGMTGPVLAVKSWKKKEG
jgi:hypothetical protein